jgi:hypothetical protein
MFPYAISADFPLTLRYLLTFLLLKTTVLRNSEYFSVLLTRISAIRVPVLFSYIRTTSARSTCYPTVKMVAEKSSESQQTSITLHEITY